jgi:hypothetical protein
MEKYYVYDQKIKRGYYQIEGENYNENLFTFVKDNTFYLADKKSGIVFAQGKNFEDMIKNYNSRKDAIDRFLNYDTNYKFQIKKLQNFILKNNKKLLKTR